MVNLGDYIGQLMSELTIARVKSDLEAARVAELYSRHELLKHFPIPKIRLNDFEMEVPFLIIGAQEDAKEKESVKTIGGNYERITIEVISRNGVELSDESKDMLHKMVDAEVQEMQVSATYRFDMLSIAKRMSPMLRKILKGYAFEEVSISDVVKDVEMRTKDSILDELSYKPRLEVAVTSAELKEADPESIVRLSLKATEEGIEWTQIACGDSQEITRRLIAE